MKFEENVPLAQFSTFRVGGPARYFISVKTVSELSDALKGASDDGLPFFILGEGSNLLISDEGFPGLVIRMNMREKTFEDLGERVRVKAEAGLNWDELVGEAVSRGLFGIENLSGIPGTVGAAPIQNIGAYGSELKDTLTSVEIFDASKMESKELSCEDCGFGYRDSFFKKKENADKIVLSVTMELAGHGLPNISYGDLAKYFSARPDKSAITSAEVREAVLAIRREKLPDATKLGTAGSFFKNPVLSGDRFEELKKLFPGIPSFLAGEKHVKIPAAWLIDKVCGLKGARKGNVGTYPIQPLALVNYGGATAREIKNFAAEIEACVREKTGIVLEWEVRSV